MKTREIEVYIHPEGIDCLSGKNPDWFTIRNDKTESCMLKAKLIIELPERKIQITESEFDEMWLTTPCPLSEPCHETVKRFKQKLFSKADP